MEKIKKIWQNKRKIFEGIWNSYFASRYVKKIASERSDICRSNKCGFYDKKGVGENVIKKGSPACGFCGCNEKYKTHSMSSGCDVGYWLPVMDEQTEDEFKRKYNLKDE